MILANIKSHSDLQNLQKKDIAKLVSEIRNEIINVVTQNGGHLASNLGVVELSVALHRVFESPHDAIVWDVGHQCYAHKLLTGRYDKFPTLRKTGGLAGFPKQSESEHDFFDTGHASTSISSALGLLMAREISGVGGKVIAVIGDGALTGGMAFEALSHAGQLSRNLIVVLNDNQMSIDQNTGSVSRYLSRLTMTAQYQTVRFRIDRFVDKIPYFNKHIEKFIFRFKRALKGLLLTNNLFVDLGFEYVGPLNGHDEHTLETIFRRVQKLRRPVVVHIVTKKGKGYKLAEDSPEKYHGVSGKPSCALASEKAVSFTEAFGKAVVSVAMEQKNVVAITAAMAQGTGLSEFSQKFPDRFFDVGIAEQHAVTFASGLAKGGLVPVVCIYSTFIQRAIDQIIHDLSLQNAHVVLAFDRAGAVPYDGETHQGIFDIVLLKSVPNMVLLSPATESDVHNCLSWAVKNACCPVAIRYAKANCGHDFPEFAAELCSGRGVLVKGTQMQFADETAGFASGKKILFACTGGVYAEALSAANLLAEKNIACDIYSLRFIKPLDEQYFFDLARQYDGVVLAEDAVRTGGVAEILAGVLTRNNFSNFSVHAMAEKFYQQDSRENILCEAKLDAEHLAEVACKLALL